MMNSDAMSTDQMIRLNAVQAAIGYLASKPEEKVTDDMLMKTVQYLYDFMKG